MKESAKTLCEDIFQTTMLDIIKEKSDEASLQEQRDEEYRQKVIEAFFEYGKLKSIPAQRKKRRIAYEVIIEAFEKGKIYSEREVNIIIADFQADFCTIRRDMISEKLLDRDGSNYCVYKIIESLLHLRYLEVDKVLLWEYNKSGG